MDARQKELKERLEELKIETGYYKTKNLIEKYDETETETRKKIGGNNKEQVANKSVVIRNRPQVPQARVSNQAHPSPISSPQLSLHSPSRRPVSPPRYNWMDRFMDALIGDDSRNQKYALICAQCFNHNGLAAPEAFASIKYRCPNCGFINPAISIKSPDNQVSKIQEITEELSESPESALSESPESPESPKSALSKSPPESSESTNLAKSESSE